MLDVHFVILLDQWKDKYLPTLRVCVLFVCCLCVCIPQGNARGAVNGSSRGGGKGPNAANGSAPQDPVTAEYASVRKVKKVNTVFTTAFQWSHGTALYCLNSYSNEIQLIKVDKATKKENGNAESDDQSSVQSSVGESPSAPPPPLPRSSQEFLQKQLDPFHLHVFPKVRPL